MRNPKIRIGLRGYCKWQVRNRAGEVLRQGQGHNVITDAGLNLVAEHVLRQVFRWIHVGDGSAAPSESDTELDSSVASVDGGGSPDDSFPAPGEVVLERTQDFGFGEATGNLTEWGTSPLSESALFNRELFRDEAGNPVVVTVTNDEMLRITVGLEVYLSPNETAGTDTITITGLDPASRDISYRFLRPPSFGTQREYVIAQELMTGDTSLRIAAYEGGIVSYDTDLSPAAGSGDFQFLTYETYVSGSHERITEEVTYPVSGAVGEIGRFLLQRETSGTAAARRAGYICAFDEGDEFTKDDTHELTIKPPDISWGRASS